MGRSPCCSNEGLNRGSWTAEEDKLLRDYISVHGEGKWRKLPQRAGLNRCGKSCRLRWLNYLRPDIKRGNISQDEEDLIIRLHRLLGNRWSLIAGRLPGRTDNEIKNYWNTNLRKKVRDPHTTRTTGAENNTQKIMPQSTLEVSPSPPLSSSKREFHSHIFHPKASKCSKLPVVDPPPQSSVQFHNKYKEQELHEADAETLIVDHDAANISAMMETSVYGNDPLLVPSEEKELFPTDLLFNFDTREVCLSDLLNSDFNSDICDFGYNNCSNEDLLPFWDKHLVPSREILKDRTQNFSEESQETDGANNFPSFTYPFL